MSFWRPKFEVGTARAFYSPCHAWRLRERFTHQIRKLDLRMAELRCRGKQEARSQNLQQRWALPVTTKFGLQIMHWFCYLIVKSFDQMGSAPFRTTMVNLQPLGVSDNRRPDILPNQSF